VKVLEGELGIPPQESTTVLYQAILEARVPRPPATTVLPGLAESGVEHPDVQPAVDGVEALFQPPVSREPEPHERLCRPRA